MHAIFFKMCLVFGAIFAASTLLGSGVAAAKDPYVGLTYADASAKISEKGRTPVISTVVGDQLNTDECVVESWRKRTFVDSDNFTHDSKQILLSLNCSAKLAHAGEPGNSLASAAGRTEKSIEEKAAKYNSKPASCEKYLASCKKFCEKNDGLCSAEVMALF